MIHWWRFDEQSELLQTAETRTSSEILDVILNEVARDENRAHLRSRINGIVGSAKSRTADWQPERLYAELQQRFANRPDLRPVQAHPDFRLFLSRKAAEIASDSQ